MFATVLRVLSRVLPGEFRERVFVPAFADYMLDYGPDGPSRGHGAIGRIAAGVVLWLEVVRLAIPSYFWYRGRLTRVGVASLAGLIGVAAFIVLVTNIQYDPIPPVTVP